MLLRSISRYCFLSGRDSSKLRQAFITSFYSTGAVLQYLLVPNIHTHTFLQALALRVIPVCFAPSRTVMLKVLTAAHWESIFQYIWHFWFWNAAGFQDHGLGLCNILASCFYDAMPLWALCLDFCDDAAGLSVAFPDLGTWSPAALENQTF